MGSASFFTGLLHFLHWKISNARKCKKYALFSHAPYEVSRREGVFCAFHFLQVKIRKKPQYCRYYFQMVTWTRKTVNFLGLLIAYNILLLNAGMGPREKPIYKIQPQNWLPSKSLPVQWSIWPFSMCRWGRRR